MDHRERFKHGLVQLVQSGALQELLSCEDGACAKVEFHLSRSYHVHLNRTHIVIHERDTELVRQHRRKRWRRFRPTVYHRGRIAIDRASGKIVHAPRLGSTQPRAGARMPLPKPRLN